MRYIIDGYNLLFKTPGLRQTASLEEARNALIGELDLLVSRLRLHVTVVFDAHFQSDELKRSHFRSLEIIFTSFGQTADDFIHDCVHGAREKIVVVTSDKTLAHKVKGCKAYVESVTDFLANLRKKSLKKKNLQQEIPKVKLKLEPKEAKESSLLPPLSDLDAWQEIFEERFQNL